MTYVRVRFNVHWGPGDYELGSWYDVEDSAELQACILTGIVDYLPYEPTGTVDP